MRYSMGAAFDSFKRFRRDGKPFYDSCIEAAGLHRLSSHHFERYVRERWDTDSDRERNAESL